MQVRHVRAVAASKIVQDGRSDREALRALHPAKRREEDRVRPARRQHHGPRHMQQHRHRRLREPESSGSSVYPLCAGACGGVVACSTCHVVVHPEFFKKLPKADEEELDMLDLAFGLTEWFD